MGAPGSDPPGTGECEMTTKSEKKPQQELKDGELEKVQGGWSWGETNTGGNRSGKLQPGTKQMERGFDDE